jgi:nitroimidazol reductase NimA-like FMN-containing flavoprotein (pyridoxamine 5'-phosphate oxidase superfamily)
MSGTIPTTSWRDGHHGLLATLRELIEGLDRPDRGLDEESLRALLAFLREGLVPFARREEGALLPDGEAWECATFEHAFLEAEIDRLSREVTPFLPRKGAGTEGEARSAALVRRTLYRIEAALEVHVLREQDRRSGDPGEGLGRGDPTPSPRGDDSLRAPPSGTMDPAEAERFLRSHSWGVLCTVGGGQPYGVPVSYGFDGRSVFIATGPGRKTSNLLASRAVCLTVAEVEDGDRWRCVVVSGEAAWLESVADRMAALWTLAGRAGRGPRVDRTAWKRLAAARLLRIDPTEVTGRQRGR